MCYIETLLITTFWVVVLDTTDLYDRLSGAVRYVLSGGHSDKPWYVKPFCCSFCMAWWCNLLYLLLTHNLTLLHVGYVLGLSFFSPTIKDLLLLLRDVFAKVVAWLYRRLQL